MSENRSFKGQKSGGETDPAVRSAQSRHDTPEEFIQFALASLQRALPDVSITLEAPLRLTITRPNKTTFTAFFDNGYREYLNNPSAKEQILADRIQGVVETAKMREAEPIQTDRILPIIKDVPWLEECRRALQAQGLEGPSDIASEPFAPGLVIVYAEDTPRQLRYLTWGMLSKAGVERVGLRERACRNLATLLPPVQGHGTDGIYMLTCGGNFEACLLVMGSIWSGGQFKVEGEIVACIPARDTLMFTGSRDQDGLSRLRAFIQKIHPTSAYHLSDQLFVYRNGAWLLFNAP